MGDSKKVTKTVKKSWFKGLKSEFKKIIWPDKATLGKQSLAAVIVTILLGIIIAIVDAAFKLGIDFVIR